MKLRFNKYYLILAHSILLMEIAIAFFLNTGFIRYTFGDYLVVIMLYAIIRGCTNLKVWVSALVVLLIAYTIEILQLFHILTYFNLQQNKTAVLIFGSTFQLSDLVAYTLGVLTILIIEYYYAKPKITYTFKI